MEKPGYKTTEFWLKLVAMLIGLLMTSGALPEGSPWLKGAVAVSTILGALGYTYVRGKVKANARSADATVAAAPADPT